MFGSIMILLGGITLGIVGLIGSDNAAAKGNIGRTLVFVGVMVGGILIVLAGFVGVLGSLSY